MKSNYTDSNVHSYEFCDEITSFILYKNKIEPKEDYNLYKYRNEMIECQKNWDLTEEELFESLKITENK